MQRNRQKAGGESEIERENKINIENDRQTEKDSHIKAVTGRHSEANE